MDLITNSLNQKSEKSPQVEPVETITLTGLYGSGKSTWIADTVKQSDEKNLFVGSETADIGMDGGSIPLDDEDIVELQNVCMACNTEGEFDQAIERVIDKLEESDRVLVEGPGNAGTRDMAGTVSSLPELDQRYVGRMVNLENWEGEKSELSEQDLQTANFIAVNRPTAECDAETVKKYLDERGMDTEVFETSPENALTLGDLEKVDEWSAEMLAKSMGPTHMMTRPGDDLLSENDHGGHSHKDTEYSRIRADAALQDVNEALLQLDEEDLEGLRIKANIRDHFVNIVNGNMQIEEYHNAVPGYLVASNFGEVPGTVKQAFSDLESLTGTSISPGASNESIKQNLRYKLENAREANHSGASSMPDIHSSALKTAEEATEIWDDDNEIQELVEKVANEYVETAMDLMYQNQDDPMAQAELATELHWTAEKADMDTEKGKEVAYQQLVSGLQDMSKEDYQEIASYSDGEDFFEYFSTMLDEAVESGKITKTDYDEARANIAKNTDRTNDSALYEDEAAA
jgi:G3E family GTPase